MTSERSIADQYNKRIIEVGETLLNGNAVIYVDPADNGSVEHDGEFMVCAVCRVPVNRFTDFTDGTESWVHARTWEDYDHDAVAVVSAGRNTRETDCDFCGIRTRLDWVFIGSRVSVGGGPTLHDYGSHWSSCTECARFINDGDIDGLYRRFLRVSPRLHMFTSKEEREAFARSCLPLWQGFIPSIHTRRYVGPPRPITKLHPRMMPKLQQGLVKFWKSPVLRDMAGVERGDSSLTVPGVHLLGREEEFRVKFPPGVAVPAAAWENHLQHLTAGIGASQLYWVSEQFTRLAVLAGKDLDGNMTISREELPAPFGFMVFDESIGEVQRPGGMAAIRAVSWTLVPAGVWINLYVQVEDSSPDIDPQLARSELGYLMCPNGGLGFPFGVNMPSGVGTEYTFFATILATWFLMNQPGVADHSTAPVDKKYARSYQREHQRKLPDVQLIDLRRRPRRISDDNTEREGRKLEYRVYRRGHWKRQLYGPGRALRKTIYVNAYIAGPEGAPLHEQPRKVNILR